MRDETWRAIEEKFARHPILRGTGATLTQIDAASAEVGRDFPEEYREFLLRYGAGIVGPYPIFGVQPVEPMGDEWSVVDVNRRYRADRWPGVEDWLIISADHGGNPMGIAGDGRVLVSDHDFGGVAPMAGSFEEFLRKHCLDLDR